VIVKESVIIRVLIDTKVSYVVETTLLVERVDTIVSDVRLAVVIDDEWLEKRRCCQHFFYCGLC
jgi:hypothetical protein